MTGRIRGLPARSGTCPLAGRASCQEEQSGYNSGSRGRILRLGYVPNGNGGPRETNG
jgi:hypothetical protein